MHDVQAEHRDADGARGPLERIGAVAALVATLDRRIIDAFTTLDRLGEASAGLEELLGDGSDLARDLRSRLDRLERRLNADLDEIKEAIHAKLGDIDLRNMQGRMSDLEVSVKNIERAVTRLDSLVEGVVETVPDFITRRVRSRADRVDETAFPDS
jgi:chromosome segregation ATPase